MPNSEQEMVERATKLAYSLLQSVKAADGFQDHVRIATDALTLERAEARREAIEEAAQVVDGYAQYVQSLYREDDGRNGKGLVVFSKSVLEKASSSILARLTPAPEAEKGQQKI